MPQKTLSDTVDITFIILYTDQRNLKNFSFYTEELVQSAF